MRLQARVWVGVFAALLLTACTDGGRDDTEDSDTEDSDTEDSDTGDTAQGVEVDTLDAGCATSVFCTWTITVDGAAGFAVPVAAGSDLTITLSGGASGDDLSLAVLASDDMEGVAVCADDAPGVVGEVCAVTASSTTLYVRVDDAGGTGPVTAVLNVHPTLATLDAAAEVTGTLAAGASTVLRVEPSADTAWSLGFSAGAAATATVAIKDGAGAVLVDADPCCSVADQALYVPTSVAASGFYVEITATTALAYTLGLVETSDGTVAAEAFPLALAGTTHDRLGDAGERFAAFTTAGAGVYSLRPSASAAVALTLRTEAGATVATTGGPTCAATSATCDVPLAAATRYVIQASGAAGTTWRLGFDAPSEVSFPLADGVAATSTVAADQTDRFAFLGAAGTAWLVQVVPTTTAQADVTITDSAGGVIIANGFCCRTQTTASFFVPADRPAGVFHIAVRNDDDAAFDYALTVVPTGTGAIDTDPAIHQVKATGTYDTHDQLRAGDSRTYAFSVPASGAWEIEVHGMDWTAVKSPVDWTLFTNPSDPDGSTIPTTGGPDCESAWNASLSLYEAICSTWLGSGTTYYVRLTEAGGNDGVLVMLAARGTTLGTTIGTGTAITGSAPPEGEWRRTVVAGPGTSWNVIVEPHDTVFATALIYDARGEQIIANGWCCGTPNFQAYFVPAGDSAPWFEVVVYNHETVETVDFSVTVVAAGDGAVGTDPVDVVAVAPGAGGWTQNDVLDANQVRFYAFETTHAGPYRIELDGMYWSEVKSPVGWTVFSDPSDPEGSLASLTHGGTACDGTWNVDQDRYDARCTALLAGNTAYVIAVQEQGGESGVLDALHILAPEGPVDEVVVGSDQEGVVLPGTSAWFWVEADPDAAYQVDVEITGGNGAGVTVQDADRMYVVGNGFGGVGRTASHFVPAERAAPIFFVQVHNGDSVQLDYELTIRPTGVADIAEEPAELLLGSTRQQTDVLDAGQDRWFAFEAPVDGPYRFQIHTMDWASVKSPVGLALYSDNEGTLVPTTDGDACSSDWDGARYAVDCSAVLEAGTYWVRTDEQGGEDDILYVLWADTPTGDWTVLAPETPTDGVLAANGTGQYLVQTVADTGYTVTVRPVGTTSANFDVSDASGAWVRGAGFCCIPGAEHSVFVPPESAVPWFSINVRDGSGSGFSYEIEVRATGGGESGADPVDYDASTTGTLFQQDILGPDGDRFWTFTTGYAGPYLLRSDGMEFTEHKSPVDWRLFTDAADPDGSTIPMASGQGWCEAEFQARGAYEARCVWALDASTTYFVQAAEQDGVPSSWYAWWLERPEMTALDLSAGTPLTGQSLAAQQRRYHVLPATPGDGYLVLIQPTTTAFGGVTLFDGDLVSQVSNGYCCGTPNPQAYFLPGSLVTETLFPRVENNDATNTLGYSLSAFATGGGESPADPADYDVTAGWSMNLVFGADDDRYWKVTTSQGGVAYRVVLTGMDWAQVKSPVSWTAFTDPNNPSTSVITTCTPVTVNNRYEADCTTTPSATTWYLKMSEDGGNDAILVNFRIWMN